MLQIENQSNIPPIISKSYKSNFVNDKISSILPELLERNLKLTDRLKGKLKVSTFLNNTEMRNQKYLKFFLSSSDNRLKIIKTGLKLSKVVKQSAKNLSKLCTKLDNDVILQNSDFLNEEKKLLNENTEQETHMKINSLIFNLKNTLKKNNIRQRTQHVEKIKYLSKSYMNNVKSVLKNKIETEKKIVNFKINSYKSKLKNSIEERKDFRNFIDNMDLPNLKLLNYRKPKPLPITDRECSSMARIKNNLYPFQSQLNKNTRKKEININQKNIPKNLSFNDCGKSQILEKDTFCVLKGLVSNGHNLPLKIDKTMNKVNSLIDMDLPNPNSYNKLLEKNHKEKLSQKSFDSGLKKEYYPPDKLEKIIQDKNELDKHLSNKLKLQKIIDTFRKEINRVKNYQVGYEQKHKINKNLILQKPLIMSYNKRKIISEKSENSTFIDQTTSVISKRIKASNKNNRKKEEDSSFLNNSSKNYESFSIKDYKNFSQSFLSGNNKNNNN